MNTPTISVVIPCYNAAPFLRETIDSVLNQTRPALEVLLIDDGSTDGSGDIAESYGQPVRVIRQENQGESVARNRGMDEALGDWIALLDADDRWLPHKLQRQIGTLSMAGPGVVCVYSDYLMFGSVRRQARSRPLWPVIGERRVRLLTDPCIQPGTALVETSAARAVRFPEGISYGEDQVFWMKLYNLGDFIHIPEPLIEYRKHAHQQTSQKYHGHRVIAALWEWVKVNPGAFNELEAEIVRKRFAQEIVGRHDEAFWANDRDVVERTRTLYRELMPGVQPLPALFERDAPTLTLRTAHATWNKLLKLLPPRLRVGLWRAARGTVERVKRGQLGQGTEGRCDGRTV